MVKMKDLSNTIIITFFRISFYFLFAFTTIKMQNDAGEFVDLYVPRKCSSSSRIISAKDHASIQLEVVEVDQATGRLIPGKRIKYAICGKLRYMGESDDCILRLAQRDGIIPQNL